MACENEQNAVNTTYTAYQSALKREQDDPSPENFKAERQAYAAWQDALKKLSSCKMANQNAPMTNLGQCLMNMGEWTYLFVVDPEGGIVYNKWKLGGGGLGWHEIPGQARTDAPPTAAAVAASNYIFITIKGLDGKLYLNQGGPGPNPENAESWVGWQSM